MIAQLEELTLLVADLVDLAREEEPATEREALRLDELVAAAVARAARHAPGVRFATDLEPAVVDGVRSRLDRAVANLLDNAAKHGGARRDGRGDAARRGADRARPRAGHRRRGPPVRVRPLLPRAAARAAGPGSGLGLAIVRQAAEAHGGSVRADRAPDGGAVLRLALSPSS